MSNSYPILRSLDPHHQRVGYLGALTTVAARSADSRDALERRFRTLLFRRIDQSDAEYRGLVSHLSPASRDQLARRLQKRAEAEPAAILRPAGRQGGAFHLSDFWILDEHMPSPLGELAENRLHRTVDLAMWTGVLLPSYELSEVGYILQQLLLDAARCAGTEAPFNLLNPRARPALPALYVRLMLAAEILFPFLVNELVERHASGKALTTRGGDSALLRASVDRLLGHIGTPTEPEEILAIRDVREFRSAIEGSESTAENYLRPRLEFLVDVGLVGRKGLSRSDFPWFVLPETERLAEEWRNLETRADVDEYLDGRFFGSLARVFDVTYGAVTDREEVLLWFARAVGWVGRNIGFTPGHAGALLACLLAWESGAVLEVKDVYAAVYEAASTDWARYLHFSGGSRLDREFLIRIDAELVTELEKRAGSTKQPR